MVLNFIFVPVKFIHCDVWLCTFHCILTTVYNWQWRKTGSRENAGPFAGSGWCRTGQRGTRFCHIISCNEYAM